MTVIIATLPDGRSVVCLKLSDKKAFGKVFRTHAEAVSRLSLLYTDKRLALSELDHVSISPCACSECGAVQYTPCVDASGARAALHESRPS